MKPEVSSQVYKIGLRLGLRLGLGLRKEIPMIIVRSADKPTEPTPMRAVNLLDSLPPEIARMIAPAKGRRGMRQSKVSKLFIKPLA